MAAVLTGTPLAISWGTGANPAGQSITIPADCTAVYMFWAGYNGTGNAGLLSATLNGASPAQTIEDSANSDTQNIGGCAIWYNPATGSQTLDPQWDAAWSEGPVCIVAYVKDGDTSAARDLDCISQDGTTAATFTLTTVAGDLVLKFDKHDSTIPSATAGWSSSTSQTGTAGSDSCLLSYISAAGTTQVCNGESESYCTLVGVSIPPAGGGGGGAVIPATMMYYSRLRH